MAGPSDVSVIIPTYNRLERLRQALQSVLEQTVSPQEIIVVDDGSEDGTADWLATLADPRIRILRQENQGPGPARNAGAALARGRLVAFLDSDDTWLKEKLARQCAFMASHPEVKISQTEEVWIRRGVRVNPRDKHAKPSGWIFEACLRLCLISPSAVMLEREFFESLGGFDPAFPVCEDYELWLRASLRSQVMTLAEALTIKHGGHDDQLSRKFPAMDAYRVAALEKTLREEALNGEQERALLNELANKLVVLAKGFPKHHPGEPNPYEAKWLQLQKNRNPDSTVVPPGP